MTVNTLTTIVLTHNERRHIQQCLDSLLWADESLVFDSFSNDGTPELARDKGARVVQHAFVNFAQQRNAALLQVRSDWVLFIDADERVPPALAEEIRYVIEKPGKAGWWIPRRNIIVGRWIQNAGWFPDYQLRLFRRGRAHYDPLREVHETVILDGAAGYMQNTLVHYNYFTWGEFLRKQKRYLLLDARVQARQGVRPKPWTYVTQPCREFYRRYYRWRGYRDGRHGFILSLLMGYTAFLTTVELSRQIRQIAGEEKG